METPLDDQVTETEPGSPVARELDIVGERREVAGDATLLYGPPNDPPLQGPDGMSRLGRTLYVVENGASRISVITLDPSTGMGTLQKVLPVVGAQTPTTSALFGSAVYTVDARLGTPFMGPYRIFRVER